MMNSLLAPDNATLIDEFCDSLWLEDGLSKNSLDAYRRDMRLFSRWLEVARPGREGLYEVSTADIEAYFAARHEESKATSSNRRLSVLKRFYQLALRQKHIAADPCLKMVCRKTRWMPIGATCVCFRAGWKWRGPDARACTRYPRPISKRISSPATTRARRRRRTGACPCSSAFISWPCGTGISPLTRA